jgi:hypothetical protein
MARSDSYPSFFQEDQPVANVQAFVAFLTSAA